MTKKRSCYFSILLFSVLVAIIFASYEQVSALDAGGLYLGKRDAIVVIFNERNSEPDDIKKEDQKNKPQSLPSVKDIVSVPGLPAVYNFSMQEANGQVAVYSTGTGFIIREDGLIVTNYHVVRNSKKITVELFGGEIYTAEIVGFDARPGNDIALLKIKPKKPLPLLRLKTANDIFVGKKLLIIGHPYLYKYTASEATVSKLAYRRSLEFVQIHSSVLPGNSGSPLLAEDGEVVGVVYSRMLDAETQGFAIPSARVEAIINEILRSSQSRP